MKIYFSGSIRGGRSNKEAFHAIVNHLKKYGNVLTEHVGDVNLHEHGEGTHPDEYIHDRDVAWIKECDLFVAEVSTPSLGVGYEIAKALEFGKKVVCFYKLEEGKKLSGMISGNKDIIKKEYNSVDETFETIDSLFEN